MEEPLTADLGCIFGCELPVDDICEKSRNGRSPNGLLVSASATGLAW